MSKLIKSLKWIDDNLVHLSAIAFILLSNLVPKYPLTFVEYTYIRIRVDDYLPVVVGVIFLIQFIRRKVKLNLRVLIPVLAFWIAVFASMFYNHYVTKTVPILNIGLLHSFRRIQYMFIFFVGSSIIVSEERFMQYLKYYFITLTIVAIFGLGQKFAGFPSIQTMNPAYADGRLLFLNPSDRINSTFGGHFDLAAYMTFSMPLVLGMYFYSNRRRYIGLYILCLTVLLYTAARSSFLAYLGSVFLFLLCIRKFRFFAFALLVTAVLLLVTGEMTKRFQETFQIKTVFVNEKTGGSQIDQKITTKQLPAGTYQIPLKSLQAPQPTPSVNPDKLFLIAQKQITEDSKKKGIKLTAKEIQDQSHELAKYIKPKSMLLCDISCATRLEVEWPRAIVAFKSNPWIGTGPSSITEATDNDLLRWLGETGLIGTVLFITILGLISRYGFMVARQDHEHRYIFYGFMFGVLALFINALYVDIFEASKMAYNFWLISGFVVGYYTWYEKRKKNA